VSSGDPRQGDKIAEYLSQFSQKRAQMLEQIHKVIIGQKQVIEQVLASIFTRGHVLLVGVPGLAKTLMVQSIAQILDVQFKRVQFTPDLMPSDITGTTILDEQDGKRAFRFVQGPIFTNILLAESTVPLPRPRHPSSRPCRSAKSPPGRKPSSFPIRSL
jgi:MoxR-like ATPase